jgi:hypothetical protein
MKLDARNIRHLSPTDWRILAAVCPAPPFPALANTRARSSKARATTTLSPPL